MGWANQTALCDLVGRWRASSGTSSSLSILRWANGATAGIQLPLHRTRTPTPEIAPATAGVIALLVYRSGTTARNTTTFRIGWRGGNRTPTYQVRPRWPVQGTVSIRHRLSSISKLFFYGLSKFCTGIRRWWCRLNTISESRTTRPTRRSEITGPSTHRFSFRGICWCPTQRGNEIATPRVSGPGASTAEASVAARAWRGALTKISQAGRGRRPRGQSAFARHLRRAPGRPWICVKHIKRIERSRPPIPIRPQGLICARVRPGYACILTPGRPGRGGLREAGTFVETARIILKRVWRVRPRQAAPDTLPVCTRSQQRAVWVFRPIASSGLLIIVGTIGKKRGMPSRSADAPRSRLRSEPLLHRQVASSLFCLSKPRVV